MIEAIREFLWTHPWWHAAAVIVPPILVSAFFSWRELRHSREAIRLSSEANRLHEESKTHVARIAELQNERNQLEGERNNLLAKIAENTKQPLSEAERNALKLRKYLRKRAVVSEGKSSWGAMGAEIVEISEDNVLTLFVPVGYSSSSAFAVYVRCDELEIIEAPVGACDLQIRILKRYADTSQLGDIRNWDDRGAAPAKPLPRGANAYHADYTRDGSPTRRAIHIYAPTDGNPQYTLVTLEDGKETGVMYDNNVEISKKFAIIQVAYLAEGFRYGGGGSGASPDRLFICTH